LATEAPYAELGQDSHTRIPTTLGDALAALQEDNAMYQGFGKNFVHYYSRIKAAEQARMDAAEDGLEFQRREYFGRI